MIIPDDARRQLMSIRDGVTETQYLDEIWKRRYAEHGKPKRSRSGRWPIIRIKAEDLPVKTAGKLRRVK